MTEPVPSDYDRLVQDPRLDGLEELVHPYYQPPSEIEHSFPVVGQGVSSEMFQQISRAAGTGVFIQSNADGAHEPYHLTNLPGGSSATNANNQMLLKVAPVTGRAEAAIDGFFHTLLQDMTIDFPAVSAPTTYYLCLTYDPRREEEEQGPIRVEVHTNSLPTTHGRKHIVLWTVQRQPNQLLTDATIQQHKQWLGHVINVWTEGQLPEPTQTEYGTLAVVVNPGDNMSSQPELYTNRGIWGWHKTGVGPWVPLNIYQGYSSIGLRARRTSTGIEVAGRVGRGSGTGTAASFSDLPPNMALAESFYTVVFGTEGPVDIHFTSSGAGTGIFLARTNTRPGWFHLNVYIPDSFLRNP